MLQSCPEGSSGRSQVACMVLLEMKCNPIAFCFFYRKLKHVIVDNNIVIAFNELLSYVAYYDIYLFLPMPQKNCLIPYPVTFLMQ